MKESNNTNNLPLPRLEFNWEKVGDSWIKRICNYYLVLPLGELDGRAQNPDGEFGVYDELKVLIGQTNVSGGTGREPVWKDGKVDTPFRDGAHMQWDNKALGGNLPMYSVCGDKSTLIESNI